jgi:N-acetylglucosaminyldiphosphoundecaprenol N-acetyl-beta-D-mannosaminyltransferase
VEKYFHINYEFNPLVVQEGIAQRIAEKGTGYVCVADANILQQVHNDLNYRKVVEGAMFSICDSSWVPVFLKWIYGIDRSQYCGSMIFKDLIEMKRYRHLFIGTSTRVLNALKDNLMVMDPAIKGMTFYEPPFCDVEDFDYPAIAEMINRDNPDIIWVALGAPKQEIFMSKLQPYLKRGVQIAVGAAFKFYSGLDEKRAPAWMRRSKLEFLYRIYAEPKKQFARCKQIVLTLPGIIREESRRKRVVELSKPSLTN